MDEEKINKKKRKINLIINIVLIALIVILVTVLLINKFVLTIMKVVGDSMIPTLHEDEKVFVYHTKKVAKDDIVVFNHDEKYVVKRVVAVGGDHVKVDNVGNVFVNGELDSKIEHGESSSHNVWDIDIEDGQIFVLGDNRANSWDSGDYGPIELDLLIGKVI